MKPEIQNLLDEFISFKTNWREQKHDRLVHLKEAVDFMTAKEVYFCVGPILLWPKELQLFGGWDKDDDFTDDYFLIDVGLSKKSQFERFENFFEKCSDVKLFLSLEEDRIKFSDELSSDEKAEIISYVQNNFKERFRSRSKPI